MRDIIIHKYDQVDFDVIWDVVYHKIPELLNLLEPLLKALDNP
jgi:uncharacterized protein with HEPN domain